ncbi:MAG: chorismate synthase [Candidatus Delongbacteria bacterium]|nr:chorismate synthase [Candidatus Delongbacteria bacterium]MCG2761225.1 chorismate synthase [Candidatus Delongbacteria bacterium]
MNSFGRIFKVEIFGESHGESVGVIVGGCPPGIELCEDDFMTDLTKRQPGQKGTTKRIEKDIPHIKSGVFNMRSTGSPIMIEFYNENRESGDYEQFKTKPRPGQADFAADKKFKGFNDYRGGGHFSGRLTVGLVAAGVIAKKILKDIEIKTRILEIGGSQNYQDKLNEAISEGDTLGGIIECFVCNVPIGLGEPFFDSIESVISHLVFSIPSVKGIEFGKGFESAGMKGSEYNDTLLDLSGRTKTNNCGGITGGLSNGNQIIFRAALRPPSSILKSQMTINAVTGKEEELSVKGRHDVCAALRARIIIESVTAAGICDLLLINRIYGLK